ncbi:tripartite tricarboxylate transporter substrate binding protein [Ramlibacter sp. G-1-2-2]|uniref:Tripartite tricarboxylate transporter substrate binding protein n=1 Tax=Ramlibacter agri TaxID=2728837 RepID=A0A848HCD5_9BURK|nr:tripartite tricarboxylate transporter substrate binding protein [Ramlibacter agri]NML46183.1 tripartite tricarboxylate transporter substrate binding protein [Ramlibacter agri]
MATFARRCLLLGGLSLLTLGASAQGAWPERQVNFVTWSSPGGNIDVAMRLVGERLAQKWKQPVVAENRTGASGIIATDYVAKARPDGYTVLFTTPTAQINTAFVRAKLPFDARRDFEPVSLLLTGQVALVAAPNAPYNNLSELVAYAKKQPKGISFGSWGIGSGGHLLGEQMKNQAKVTMVHVPYKGGELAEMADVIGGSLDTAFMANGNAKIQSQAGKIKVLAITGQARHKDFPTVATFREQGYSGFDAAAWIGAYVPAGTPKAVVAKLSADMAEVLKQPDIAARLEGLGFGVEGSTPAEFANFTNEQYKLWGNMIEAAGIPKE